jgi:hypothetical protein
MKTFKDRFLNMVKVVHTDTTNPFVHKLSFKDKHNTNGSRIYRESDFGTDIETQFTRVELPLKYLIADPIGPNVESLYQRIKDNIINYINTAQELDNPYATGIELTNPDMHANMRRLSMALMRAVDTVGARDRVNRSIIVLPYELFERVKTSFYALFPSMEQFEQDYKSEEAAKDNSLEFAGLLFGTDVYVSSAVSDITVFTADSKDMPLMYVVFDPSTYITSQDKHIMKANISNIDEQKVFRLKVDFGI